MTSSLVDRAAHVLETFVSRRSFITRSAFVGSAVAIGGGVDLALRPGTAYGAICQCANTACDCSSTCCSGFSEFCCSVNGGYNYCPEDTVLGGWWKADNSAYCSGPRYYMDCNAVCGCTNGCGGSWHFCDPACDGQTCGCGAGNCNHWAQACFQFRYGQCNQNVDCMGRIVCRVVACTPPWEIDPTCTTVVAVDEGTAAHNAPCWTAYPPVPPPGQGPGVSNERFAVLAVSGYVHVYKRSTSTDLVEWVNDGANGRLWNAYDLTVYGAGPSLAGNVGVGQFGPAIHAYGRTLAGDLVEFVNDGANGRLWNAYDLSLYGHGPVMAGDPVPCPFGGLIHVYGRDHNDHLVEFVNDEANGRLWNAYDLTYYGPGPAVAGDPGPVVADGFLHVYTRAADDHLVEWVNDGANGRLWNAYDLTYFAGGPTIVGDPMAVVLGTSVHIYTTGSNGHLVEWVNDGAKGRQWNAYDLTYFAGGPDVVWDPAPIVVGTLIHVYSTGSNGHLVEWVNDGANGRLWNSYDLTYFGSGPSLAGDATPIVLGGTVHVYATATTGELTEYVNDGANRRLWNSYDLTYFGGGPQVAP
jgi:hypothetical protein